MTGEDADARSRARHEFWRLVRGGRLRDLPARLSHRRKLGDQIERLFLSVSQDEYTPEGVVPMDKASIALLDAAQGLAGDSEWGDAEAVAELRRLAKRRPEALRAAEDNARHRGYYRDFEIENRAQRLLAAALTGETVEQPSEEDQRRFRVVEPFADLPEEEQWAHLVAAAPGLGDLAAQAAAGAFRMPPVRPGRPPTESERAHWAAHGEALRRLTDRVREIVGPHSGAQDTLLASAYANEFAMNYLLSTPRIEPS